MQNCGETQRSTYTNTPNDFQKRRRRAIVRAREKRNQWGREEKDKQHQQRKRCGCFDKNAFHAFCFFMSDFHERRLSAISQKNCVFLLLSASRVRKHTRRTNQPMARICIRGRYTRNIPKTCNLRLPTFTSAWKIAFIYFLIGSLILIALTLIWLRFHLFLQKWCAANVGYFLVLRFLPLTAGAYLICRKVNV